MTIKKLLLQNIDKPHLTNWHKTKRTWAKNLKRFPKNSEILSAYEELISENKITRNSKIEKSLKVRKVRTLSGVAPFAVMMKPYKCPGNCIYCVQEKGMPKSYMSDEPAATRAKKLKFDPQDQIISRLDQMEKTGHTPEKLEIIVIGGTFSAYPDSYKKSFLKAIFDTCNNAEALLRHSEDCNQSEESRLKLIIPKTIEQSQKLNQSAKYRIIGMSIETRPDWITKDEIKLLRQYGITRVQMGVQALDEEILVKINRGHSIDKVAYATKLLRNAGFKINYHFMPNLPGSNPKKDIEMAKLMFSDSRFKPDTLKIYPCVVLPNTPLEKLFQKSLYKPYSDKILMDTLIKIKQLVPQYCRIDRLVRDITTNWTIAGTKKTNMRQLIHQKMAKDGLVCNCIRCREVRDRVEDNEIPELKISKYQANDGQEFLLTYEKKNKLFAMLRLRFPYFSSPCGVHSKLYAKKDVQGETPSDSMVKGLENSLFPVLKNSALIRELHVFGQQQQLTRHSELVSESLRNKSNPFAQHKSLGKKLIAKAEELSKENGFNKIAIISGVGVRDYYQKLGYELKETYMVKSLIN